MTAMSRVVLHRQDRRSTGSQERRPHRQKFEPDVRSLFVIHIDKRRRMTRRYHFGAMATAVRGKDAFIANRDVHATRPLKGSSIGDLMPCQSGDDACIITPTIAVLADGVGSSKFAAEYAKTLVLRVMHEVCYEFHKASKQAADDRLVTAIETAVCECDIGAGRDGSSTLCTVVLTGGSAWFGNLGDSGAMVLRKSPHNIFHVVFRTAVGQHAWNTPHQVSSTDSHEQATHVLQEQLTVSSFRLHADDIVIVASDGVFDNLTDEEIAVLVTHQHRNLDCLAVARTLAHVAQACSISRKSTPYSRNLAAHLGKPEHPTGKLDDVSVCVGRVALLG
jgi:serine/threonine protein phosphatase PrpC